MATLIEAVLADDLDAVKALLAGGSKPDDEVDEEGRTPLLNAAIDGKIEIARALIQAGAGVDFRDGLGNTALHYAAQEYRPEVSRTLLDAGATVDLEDIHGNSPLWRAVFHSRGRGDLIEILLAAGADRGRRNKRGKSPLDLARTIANDDVIRFFGEET